MLTDKIQLRPQYGEVDQMGYVYHANYLSYCHKARTELLRKYGINDKVLEENGVLLPVISFEINYLKPLFYDELILIKTVVQEMPEIRFSFEFEIFRNDGILASKAKSTVVFADSKSRFPMMIPDFAQDVLEASFKANCP